MVMTGGFVTQTHASKCKLKDSYCCPLRPMLSSLYIIFFHILVGTIHEGKILTLAED